MYRDLSAQLAAKEEELTEAREEAGRLQARVLDLEAQLGEVTGSMGNRDAVLKNALVQNQELTRKRDEMEEELGRLRDERAALKKAAVEAGQHSVIADLLSIFDALKK